MNALDDVIGEKIFGKLCYGPPHRLNGPEHALRCHRYRRRITSAVVGIIIGLIASVFFFTSQQFPKDQSYSISENGSIYSKTLDSSSDRGRSLAIAIGIFLAVAPTVSLTAHYIYGLVVTSGYNFYNDLFLEKKAMYMSTGDSEKRAEVLADNDVANEFDRRKVAARYAH